MAMLVLLKWQSTWECALNLLTGPGLIKYKKKDMDDSCKQQKHYQQQLYQTVNSPGKSFQPVVINFGEAFFWVWVHDKFGCP